MLLEMQLGPNVSIGKNVVVGSGTRIRESVILANSVIGGNSLVKHAVIGSDASVGDWARIEGTPNDPNPNKPFAKMECTGLFNEEGRLNPAVTILGEYFTLYTKVNQSSTFILGLNS